MDTNNGGKDELPDQSKASKKGRSCKGTLYYSSALKSKAYNPLCVGIPRAIPEVPQSIVAETEMKASKDDRHLTEFRYACAGYSVYLDRITKDHSEEQPELPVCYGLKPFRAHLMPRTGPEWITLIIHLTIELLVGKRKVQKTPAPLLFLPMSITNGMIMKSLRLGGSNRLSQPEVSSSTGLQETQILLHQG